jgi:hypothetical protein
MGWFDILAQADELIFLDTVQFEKRSWQQRNRIVTRDGLQMITIPVLSKGRQGQAIYEVRLADADSPERLLRTLRMNYAKAPYFRAVFGELEELLPRIFSTGLLIEVNEGLIDFLARWLGIATPRIRASEVAASGSRGEYLSAICAARGADTYLSTRGAADYLREDLVRFRERRIRVMIHDYEHPRYSQLWEPFAPFASALDAVMMLGPDSGQLLAASHGRWTELSASSGG